MKVKSVIYEIPDFAKKIRDAKYDLKKEGVHFKHICASLDITMQTWYHLENGRTQAISEEFLIELETVLKVSLRENAKELSAA